MISRTETSMAVAQIAQTLVRFLLLLRPKTLLLSLSPLLVGSALSLHQPGFSWRIFTLCCITGAFLQMLANVINDIQDFRKGVDSAQRLGPPRAAERGWFAVSTLVWIAVALTSGALISGLWLAWYGGWIVIAMGVCALLGAYLYSAGPQPISYTPFGEVYTIAFFGFLPTCATYYLQNSVFSGTTILPALAQGVLAANVLLVNNYRDMESDYKAGRRTLAIQIGRKSARHLYGCFLGIAFLCLVLFSLLFDFAAGLVVLVLAPVALVLWRKFCACPITPRLNRYLGASALFQFVFSACFALCLVLYWR